MREDAHRTRDNNFFKSLAQKQHHKDTLLFPLSFFCNHVFDNDKGEDYHEKAKASLLHHHHHNDNAVTDSFDVCHRMVVYTTNFSY